MFDQDSVSQLLGELAKIRKQPGNPLRSYEDASDLSLVDDVGGSDDADKNAEMSDDTDLAAHFHTDLECLVFEHAAYRNHKTALLLAPIAKRVQRWFAIPILYAWYCCGGRCSSRVEPLIYEYIPRTKTILPQLTSR